jgi:hypothetical protein
MKNSAPLITMIILGILVISACARQPAQQAQSGSSATSDSTANGPSEITVSTSIPVESGPLNQITPAPALDTSIEPAFAAGKKIITLAEKGKTMTLATGESFLLKLDQAYTWEISLSNQTVISRLEESTPTLEIQGVYEALKAGIVTLEATGDPLCRQSKHPCGRPSILFEITIVVK